MIWHFFLFFVVDIFEMGFPIYPPSWPVGWSDLVLFSFFEKSTHFCWSGLFLGVKFKKWATSAVCASVVAKNHRDLKKEYYIFKLAKSFLLLYTAKNNCQKENLKLKLFFPQKNGQNCFRSVHLEILFFYFCSFLTLKK